MAQNIELEQIITKLKTASDGEEMSLDDVVLAFEERGFGPLLIAPALLALLPIPGVPSLCGIVIIFMAAQILIGRDRPWLPQRIRQISIGREKLVNWADKALPYARKIDKLIKPRLYPLTGQAAIRIMAAVCIFLALMIIPLELLPMAAAVPALALILIGLALSSNDGILMCIAIAMAFVTLWIAFTGVT